MRAIVHLRALCRDQTPAFPRFVAHSYYLLDKTTFQHAAEGHIADTDRGAARLLRAAAQQLRPRTGL